MKKDLIKKIAEENKYYELLASNPQYRLQGYSMKKKKVIVGIIKGNPDDYKQPRDHLNFQYFDSWKDAYIHLENKSASEAG